jgi:hypothetical protein
MAISEERAGYSNSAELIGRLASQAESVLGVMCFEHHGKELVTG